MTAEGWEREAVESSRAKVCEGRVSVPRGLFLHSLASSAALPEERVRHVTLSPPPPPSQQARTPAGLFFARIADKGCPQTARAKLAKARMSACEMALSPMLAGRPAAGEAPLSWPLPPVSQWIVCMVQGGEGG